MSNQDNSNEMYENCKESVEASLNERDKKIQRGFPLNKPPKKGDI